MPHPRSKVARAYEKKCEPQQVSEFHDVHLGLRATAIETAVELISPNDSKQAAPSGQPSRCGGYRQASTSGGPAFRILDSAFRILSLPSRCHYPLNAAFFGVMLREVVVHETTLAMPQRQWSDGAQVLLEHAHP